MELADCISKYESGHVRLLLGDKAGFRKIVDHLNEQIKTKDGFLRQGINRANISHAIHAALKCYESRILQSADPKQTTLNI